MKMIKVLVVDDSAFMRKLISSFLQEDERLEVVGIAKNGEEALKKIADLSPQVITLDVEMPIMNGIEALTVIMEKNPTPCIMLSSTTSEGAENTFLAMQAGAFDFIPKPSGAISLDLHKIKEELIEKVIAASKTDVYKLRKSFLNGNDRLPEIEHHSELDLDVKNNTPHSLKYWSKGQKKIVCIGTSTGGPRALQSVLTKIPFNFDAPILVVQHMPAGFTKSLANRLNSLSSITVKEATDGEIIQKGTAYIAPGGYHLKVKKIGISLAICLDQEPLRNGHRPSVDVLFESVSENKEYSKVAVIMTGMGNDGSKGLIKLKESGIVKAIAESQETSVVFGMPKAAISTSYIDKIENVDRIADAIIKYCEN